MFYTLSHRPKPSQPAESGAAPPRPPVSSGGQDRAKPKQEPPPSPDFPIVPASAWPSLSEYAYISAPGPSDPLRAPVDPPDPTHDLSSTDDLDWIFSHARRAKAKTKKTGVNRDDRFGSRSGFVDRATNSHYQNASSCNAKPAGISKSRKNETEAKNALARKGHGPTSSATSRKLSSISVSTLDAFPSLSKCSHGFAKDTADDVNTKTLWAALCCIPGFAFPALERFLDDHHPWALCNMAGAVGHDAIDDTDGRINSINSDMPLGARQYALYRLAFILGSVTIKKLCGHSLPRMRLPIFIKMVLDETSRVWAGEIADVDRNLAAAKRSSSPMDCTTPTSLATKVQHMLARRFGVHGQYAQDTIFPTPLLIDTDDGGAVTSTCNTTSLVHGEMLFLAMQDLVSILTSARSLFTETLKDGTLPRALQTPARQATRQQQGVRRAFDTALETFERLKELQRELDDHNALLNAQAAAGDSLVNSLQLALAAMRYD